MRARVWTSGPYRCSTPHSIENPKLSSAEAELSDRGGESVGTATLTDEGASGEITVPGEEHPFTATAASGEAAGCVSRRPLGLSKLGGQPSALIAAVR